MQTIAAWFLHNIFNIAQVLPRFGPRIADFKEALKSFSLINFVRGSSKMTTSEVPWCVLSLTSQPLALPWSSISDNVWEWGMLSWWPLLELPSGYPIIFVKSLQLICRLGTRRWNRQVPNLQLSCSDLMRMRGYQDGVPVMVAQVTYSILPRRCWWYYSFERMYI